MTLTANDYTDENDPLWQETELAMEDVKAGRVVDGEENKRGQVI
jgi:hypothetical protein